MSADSSPNITKIERVREEPQLIGIGMESAESASAIEPGGDPLSQFVASSTSSHGNGSGDVSSQSSEAGLQNHEGGAGGREHSGEETGFRYGRCLTEEDHRAIRSFVSGLVSKKLLPHLNDVLKSVNEWVSVRGVVLTSK